MRKLFSTKRRIAATVLSVGLVAGAAGVAGAFFTTTGNNTGTTTVGTAGSWTVGTAALTGTLYPGQGSATMTDTVQNPSGHGHQGLNNLEVQITSVSENSPGTGFDTSESADPCTTAMYELATTNSGWALSTVANTDDTANFAISTASDIAPGDYAVTSGTGAPTDNGTTGNALPSGLTIKMLNNGSPQDRCQGATVTVTVTAS